jgi:hypothetical protein
MLVRAHRPQSTGISGLIRYGDRQLGNIRCSHSEQRRQSDRFWNYVSLSQINPGILMMEIWFAVGTTNSSDWPSRSSKGAHRNPKANSGVLRPGPSYLDFDATKASRFPYPRIQQIGENAKLSHDKRSSREWRPGRRPRTSNAIVEEFRNVEPEYRFTSSGYSKTPSETAISSNLT